MISSNNFNIDSVKIVKLLLECGADPNIRLINHYIPALLGQTALYFAIIRTVIPTYDNSEKNTMKFSKIHCPENSVFRSPCIPNSC